MRTLLPLVLLGTSAAAETAPPVLGLVDCVETTIASIGARLEGDEAFESGTGVLYANGLTGVSYDRIKDLIRSEIGDPVRLCLVSVPEGCPPGDDRGKVYAAQNLRNGGTWELMDSQHMCGGA